MATTTNYGWTTPDNTDAVANGALAIRTLGSAVDTSLFAVANAALPQWKSGKVYRNGIYRSANYTQASLQDVAYVPFYVPNTVTLASVSFCVGDSATASTKMAIYNSDATTYKPTTLVANLGSASGATTGVKTISTSQVLNAGLYWVAIQLGQTVSYGVYEAEGTLRDELFSQISSSSLNDAIAAEYNASYETTDGSFPTADITAKTFLLNRSAPLIMIAVA